jgi:prepilin peptidase CpaA
MLTTVLLLGFVSIAAATDLLWHKIHNATTYGGILAALALNLVGTAWVAAAPARQAQAEAILGWIGPVESIFGLAACGLVMLVCFVMLRVGGGDVKLMAMLGAFLGPEDGIEAMLWTFVLGGCMGLIVLIWRVGPVRLAAAALRQLAHTLRLGRWSPLTDQQRRQLQPPLFLAPTALAAVLIVRFSLLDFMM